MASVMPGTWVLTNRNLPSGENVGPVNSEYVGEPLEVPLLSMLRAIAYVGPPGTVLSTCEARTPSSASTSVPHGVTVTLSGPSKVRSAYFGGGPSPSAAALCGKYETSVMVWSE